MSEEVISRDTTIPSDQQELVQEINTINETRCFGHPRLCLFLSYLTLVLTAHGVVIYFIYFRDSKQD